ncbi:hypothetical protein AB2B38_012680 [Balneola sp. MJW-20]|uniref:hypothetical protein n=1 Tax=Gracilimonas aurantiaca TaxID=3234185 RepID=UPI003464EF1D
MKKLKLLVLLLLLPLTGFSQFIDVNLNLQPQIIATVERPIRFGTVISGSGNYTIDLGDENMGIFSVEGLVGQEILVDVVTPTLLIDQSVDAGSSGIPISLQIRSGGDLNNPFNSTLINTNTPAVIRIESEDENDPVSKNYFYVTGNINVGPVPTGTYTGSVVLNVSYL